MTYRDMLMGLGPPPIKLGPKMTPEEVTALLKSLEKPKRARKRKAIYSGYDPITLDELRAKAKADFCKMTNEVLRELPRFDTLAEAEAYALNQASSFVKRMNGWV